MAVITVQFKVGVPRTEALVRLYDTVHSHPTGCPPPGRAASRSSSPRASTTCPSSATHGGPGRAVLVEIDPTRMAGMPA
jgi:hypothetical protein